MKMTNMNDILKNILIWQCHEEESDILMKKHKYIDS